MIRLLPLLLASCVIGSDRYARPRDLEPATLITKPRLLAVKAVPAEPRPGDTVVLEALLVDPTDTVQTVVWLACPPGDADGGTTGCIDEEQELIGVEPFTSPTLTPDADVLDDLSEEERREGRYVLVQVTGLPAIDPAELQAGIDFDDLDLNEVEAGFKRVVVSEATTPNHNPELRRFRVDDEVLPPGTVLEVDPDQPYAIGIELVESSLESYEYLNSDGEVEIRTEEPYVAWYSTGGSVTEPITLHPFLDATWISPVEAGDVTVWAVARDRRGGYDWASLTLRVR